MDAPDIELPLGSPKFKEDPAPLLMECASREWVRIRMPIIGRTWLATSYETLNEVLRSPDRFSRDSSRAGKRFLPGLRWWMPPMVRTLSKNLLATDGADHRRQRKLVQHAFERASVTALQPRLDELCREHLRQWMAAQQGSYDSKINNLVPHYAQPVPLAIICELVGLPEQDRQPFIKWFRGFAEVNSLWRLGGAFQGVRRTVKYLRKQVQEVRRQPRAGLISELVQVQLDGDRLSEDELVSMLFLLLAAGHETTVHLIAGMVWLLLKYPEQRARLQANRELLEPAILETLRFYCPVQVSKPRWVTEDVSLAGYDLQRGQMITACLAAANLDEREFPKPLTFDIARTPNRQLAFGVGPHVCLGLKLAVAEASAAIGALLDHCPQFEHSAGQPIRFSKRLGIRSLSELPLTLVPAV